MFFKRRSKSKQAENSVEVTQQDQLQPKVPEEETDTVAEQQLEPAAPDETKETPPVEPASQTEPASEEPEPEIGSIRTETTEKLLARIETYQKELFEAKAARDENRKMVTNRQFTLLLGGVSTCRKVPGIPGHPGYDNLFLTKDENQQKMIRDHLKKMYGVVDKESLEKTWRFLFTSGAEYEDFLHFWSGTPSFELNKLNPKAKEIFLKAKAYAENFRPIVGEKGFFAWDINETITLYRTACSAGIITPQEFWERTQQLVRFAIARYHSWEEYAISLLCGATYFMFRQDKMQETMLENFLNININMVQFLFGPQGKWTTAMWPERLN